MKEDLSVEAIIPDQAKGFVKIDMAGSVVKKEPKLPRDSYRRSIGMLTDKFQHGIMVKFFSLDESYLEADYTQHPFYQTIKSLIDNNYSIVGIDVSELDYKSLEYVALALVENKDQLKALTDLHFSFNDESESPILLHFVNFAKQIRSLTICDTLGFLGDGQSALGNAVKQFTNLRNFKVYNINLENYGFDPAIISNFKQLEELSLPNAIVGNDLISYLERKPLKFLEIADNNRDFNAAFLERLLELPLQSFAVQDCYDLDEEELYISKLDGPLQSFLLRGDEQHFVSKIDLSDSAVDIEKLLEILSSGRYQKLQKLDLSGCHQTGDEEELVKYISRETVMNLLQACPNLEELRLPNGGVIIAGKTTDEELLSIFQPPVQNPTSPSSTASSPTHSTVSDRSDNSMGY